VRSYQKQMIEEAEANGKGEDTEKGITPFMAHPTTDDSKPQPQRDSSSSFHSAEIPKITPGADGKFHPRMITQYFNGPGLKQLDPILKPAEADGEVGERTYAGPYGNKTHSRHQGSGGSGSVAPLVIRGKSTASKHNRKSSYFDPFKSYFDPRATTYLGKDEDGLARRQTTATTYSRASHYSQPSDSSANYIPPMPTLSYAYNNSSSESTTDYAESSLTRSNSQTSHFSDISYISDISDLSFQSYSTRTTNRSELGLGTSTFASNGVGHQGLPNLPTLRRPPMAAVPLR